MKKSLLSCSLVSFVFFATGCGGGGDAKMGPKTVPVSGTVYLDEKPLAGAEITFGFEDFSSNAKTDAEGKYQLVLGAPVGENKVYVTKWIGDKIEINPDEGMDEGQFAAMADAETGGSSGVPAPAQQIIPARFSDPSQTEIKYPVPEGGTESADIRLKSK